MYAKGDEVVLLIGGEEWPLNGFIDGATYKIKKVNPDHSINDGRENVYCIINNDGKTGFARESQLLSTKTEDDRYLDDLLKS